MVITFTLITFKLQKRCKPLPSLKEAFKLICIKTVLDKANNSSQLSSFLVMWCGVTFPSSSITSCSFLKCRDTCC